MGLICCRRLIPWWGPVPNVFNASHCLIATAKIPFNVDDTSVNDGSQSSVVSCYKVLEGI